MISKEDIDAMKPEPEVESVSIKLDDITVDYKKKSALPDRPYRIEALSGSMDWFSAKELLDWQKRMNTAIRLVLERVNGAPKT